MICEINSYMLIAIIVMNITKIISHTILYCTYFRSDCCSRLCCDVYIENHNNHNNNSLGKPIVFETSKQLSANMGPKIFAGVTPDGHEVGFPLAVSK
jgi:hypothetical protein